MPRDISIEPKAGQRVIVNPVGSLKIAKVSVGLTKLTATVTVAGTYVEKPLPSVLVNGPDIAVSPQAGQRVIVNPAGSLKVIKTSTGATKLTATVTVEGTFVPLPLPNTDKSLLAALMLADKPTMLLRGNEPSGVSSIVHNSAGRTN